MPIYEYEPLDHDCLICKGRVEALQRLADEPLNYCPTCGLGVRRVVSQASVRVERGTSADKAAERGFSTFKRSGKGTYERIAGVGPEMISAREEPRKKSKKVIDLDKLA